MAYQIYIVEDHPIMRQAYELLLRRAADVELLGSAESAEEAWSHFADCPCDLLVTDVSLPGASGIDLLRRVRAHRPNLPVIVVSIQEAFRPAAMEAGAQAFLTKDELARTLLPTVREVLAAGGSAPLQLLSA